MHDFIKISAQQSNTKEKLLKKQTTSRVKKKSEKFGFQVIKTTNDKTNDWIVMERPCIT